MTDNNSETPAKVKRGRKAKEKTGVTVFIPAHLVDYIMAVLAVDKIHRKAK